MKKTVLSILIAIFLSEEDDWPVEYAIKEGGLEGKSQALERKILNELRPGALFIICEGPDFESLISRAIDPLERLICYTNPGYNNQGNLK